MQNLILTFGYAAIFGLMLLESACVPVPSEVTMLLAGAVAGGAVAGEHLNIVAVILIGTAGNVAGSYIAWALGRYAGPAALRRYGRALRVREADLDRAHVWFERHGAASVFFGRLLPVVRTFISLPAGFAAMPPSRFGLYTVAGCLPWTAALGWAGYAIGASWESVANGFHAPTYILAAVVVVGVVASLTVLWRKRHSPTTLAGDASMPDASASARK